MAFRYDEDVRLQNHIYSLDIDLSLGRDLAKKDKNISFIEGDASKIEQAFPEHLLKVNNHNGTFLVRIRFQCVVFFTYFYIDFALTLHYNDMLSASEIYLNLHRSDNNPNNNSIIFLNCATSCTADLHTQRR